MKVSDFYPQAMEELISEFGWKVTDGVIDLSQCETTVTENEIINKAQELFNEWQRLEYQRDRKYPELGEQFDLLFKDIDSGKVSKDGGFYKAIKAVKDKHPKPSE